MIALRGHHLFCAALFQGHGYNQAFTARMQAVLTALEEGEPFALCQGSDDLCAACPHRRPEGCALGTEDVLRRDAAALRVCGFEAGQELLPSQAGEQLRRVREPHWQLVCGGCRWQREGLCSWELFQQLCQDRFG